MTKKNNLLWISVALVILIAGGLLYYFLVFQKNKQSMNGATYELSDIEILSRLTAPLDTQSGSTNILDIQSDLDATDFSILVEGLPQ